MMFRFFFLILTIFTPISILADDICGKIESGALSIPSYRFQVQDKDGKPIKDLRVKGELLLQESKWGHTYNDWNWEEINHITDIPVRLDLASGLYVSDEIKNIPVPARKHMWPPKSKCYDKIRSVTFTFTRGDRFSNTEGFQGLFSINLQGSLKEINMPSDESPIKIRLSNWYGTEYL